MNDEKKTLQLEDLSFSTDEVETKERLTAFVRLAVGLVAQAATMFAWAFDANLWYAIAVTAVDLYIMVRHLWWKNNNVTSPAIIGQQLTKTINDTLKKEEKK